MENHPNFSGRGAGRRLLPIVGILLAATATAAPQVDDAVLQAGHPSLAEWLLPEPPAAPAEVIALGERLFFEEGLSADGDMSCGTCHDPAKGWSDARPTAVGRSGQVLPRATPTIVNSAYNAFHGWDGANESLEDQAMNPVIDANEMSNTLDAMLAFLRGADDYQADFAAAFPGDPEPVSEANARVAIAAFERTVVSRDSRFDRWVAGEASAMSAAEIRGFAVFLDPERGNCAVCHAAPNFTDDGFHNLGLASYGGANPDVGRYTVKPIRSMHGAFKTPTLRDVALTAPYFHDGSAATLEAVIAHYVDGGVVTDNLSPNFAAVALSDAEQADLAAFMRALTDVGNAATAKEFTNHPDRASGRINSSRK